jgi:hypothetical protein
MSDAWTVELAVRSLQRLAAAVGDGFKRDVRIVAAALSFQERGEPPALPGGGVESLPFGAARTFAMMLQEEGALIRISTRSRGGGSAWIEVRASTVLEAARAVLADRPQDAPAPPQSSQAQPRAGRATHTEPIPGGASDAGT